MRPRDQKTSFPGAHYETPEHRAAASSPASPQTGTLSHSRRRSPPAARQNRSAAACPAASQSESLPALPPPVRAAGAAPPTPPSAGSTGSPSPARAPVEPHRRCRHAGGNARPPTPPAHSASVADPVRDRLPSRPRPDTGGPSCGCTPARLRSAAHPTPTPSAAASLRPLPASASPLSAVTPPATQAALILPLSDPPLSEGVQLLMSPRVQFYPSPDSFDLVAGTPRTPRQ